MYNHLSESQSIKYLRKQFYSTKYDNNKEVSYVIIQSIKSDITYSFVFLETLKR